MPRRKGQKTPSPFQRELRDSYIALRAGQGADAERIGEEVGLSADWVRRILREQETNGPPDLIREDPLDVVTGLLDGYQRDLRALMLMSLTTENEPVALGAMKAAQDTRGRIIELLQHTGRLPRDLGTLAGVVQLRTLAAQLVDVLWQAEEGRATVRDAIEVIEEFRGLGAAPPTRAVTAPE